MVTFTARRSEPELVVPARATPREVLSLSDLDNQLSLRSYITLIEFFRCRVPAGAQGAPEQLASSLKAALAETLVHYHPMAGRLRELQGGKKKKLVVDCTAQGVAFVEAQANVRLEELEKPLVPPYPCVEELVCDVGCLTAVIGKPLLYLQMTQLRCGGTVLALTMCHSVVDAFGMVQILRCILDLARGQTHPAVLPVWERHLLVSSSLVPPHSSSDDPASAFQDIIDVDANMAVPPPLTPLPLDHLVIRSFLFGPREIAAMRSRGVPGSSTVFELITAAVWRCRVAALEYASSKRVRVMFSTNARGSWMHKRRRLPPGFYGNAFFTGKAESSAGELCQGSLERAVVLVREARLKVTDEYVASVLDVMARGEYLAGDALDGTFAVSDMSRCGDDSLDLGSWAERVAGGTPGSGGIFATLSSIYMNYKHANGDECVVVPMCLPEPVMERFIFEIAALTNGFTRSSM